MIIDQLFLKKKLQHSSEHPMLTLIIVIKNIIKIRYNYFDSSNFIYCTLCVNEIHSEKYTLRYVKCN